jgi:hypothetical protein
MKNIMNIARLSYVCPEMKSVAIPEIKQGFFSGLFGKSSKKTKKVKKGSAKKSKKKKVVKKKKQPKKRKR